MSTTNGYPLKVGTTVELILDVTDDIQLYAVADGSATELRTLELA